ncbi:MAG: hypothetical protein ABIN25_12550 [Ginsengibacter sp.]
MKVIVRLIAGCILLAAQSCSQSHKITRGYAFARSIMPGVKKGVSLNEDGTVTEKPIIPGVKYFIFFETKDSANPQVKNVWIRGMEYSVTIEKIKDIPVGISADSFNPHREDSTTLNKMFLWQINVGQMITLPGENRNKPSPLKEPEVLIPFLDKNKIQYFSIAKLQYLEPMMLQ